jgi:glycosyltransferase involved in cell wall biosynthesis
MGVSIVLPVHDADRFVAAALDSVLAQTLLPDEIVAVDDGSTDGSAAILAGYPQVRVIHQANAGCAAARNRGIEAARHDTIAFLDADDLWMPHRLERALAALGDTSRPDFVVCAQENFLTPGLAAAPGWLDAAMLAHAQHGFSTNTLVARRAAFARVGLFDPLRRVMSDSEWLVRALDAGLTYLHIDEPLVRRRIHERNVTGTLRGTREHGIAMAEILHASLVRRRSAGKRA